MARFAILLLVLITLLLPAACGEKQQYKKITLSDTAEEATTAPQSSTTPLRIAVAGVISPKETLTIYNDLLVYLGEKLHLPVELVQRGTYSEINELIKSRDVDLAFICSLAYVVGRSDFGMELLVVPQVGGETVYYSYIIVAGDSSIQRLEDLRGKTFAFTDHLSNSGRLAPTYMLAQIGETPGSFFAGYFFTYSHDNSIKAVAEKLVDGAAVDSLVYDYTLRDTPSISSGTKIIIRSGPFGIPPVVVHPALDEEFKTQLRGLFLTMHEDEEGRRILTDLMIDRFVLGDDRSYDTIREMAEEVGW